MPVTSRPAVPADFPHFARLFPELATGDPLPDQGQWEAAQMPGTRFFEDGAEVVAYAYAVPMAEVGYVRHVVVDPAHRGRGLGKIVMETLARSFRAAGCARWVLNVKPDNTPALRLYEGAGMRPAYRSTALRLAWAQVAALPAPDRDVTARQVSSNEDPALEDAFAMPRGTLASSRQYPDRVVLRLVDRASPGEARVGLASFNPHFPGAFPFKVASPRLARPLFEAMRPYALPEHDHVGIVAEDDAALTQLLVERGAEVRLEIVHYEGELPA